MRTLPSIRRSSRHLILAAVLVTATLLEACWTSSPPERLRLLPLMPDAPASDRCELGGDSREARRLASGQSISFRVRVPPQAVLRYAVTATTDSEAAWELRIEPLDGQPGVTDSVPAPQGWSERTLDLATLGGKDVVVRAQSTGAETCWGAPTIVPHTLGPSLVVVVLLDTVRADHLHLLGYHRPTTPVLDRIAEQAVVFTDAASDVSWTRASVATLITGQPSMVHGVLKRDALLDATHPTMAEQFRARGFRTVALSTNPNVLPVWGFARGFDRFVDVDAEHWSANSDAARVFAVARAAVEDAGDDPLLLYVHVNDAHAPYDPPIETARALFGTYAADGPGKNIGPNSSPAEVTAAVDRYDAEIAYVDRQLGEFFAFLEAQHLWRDALVVVVGDHGEEFREHGGVYHGHTLFREQLHIPLVMKLPRMVGGGERVATAARVMDVLPTMLNIVGPAAADLPGRLLVDRDGRPTGGTSLPRFATTDMDQATVYAVEDETTTFIVQTRPAARQWLFDRIADPLQSNDLSDRDPERRQRLQVVLDSRLLAHRRGWHVRICGAQQQPGRLAIRIATNGTPIAIERIDLEPEDRLDIAADGASASLISDLQPQQTFEEQFGKLVPRAKADRDELTFSGAPAFELSFDGTTLPVLIGLAKEPVRAPSLHIALADATTPAVFAPDCPGFGFVFVWHSGEEELRPQVDSQTLDRLRALGYAH